MSTVSPHLSISDAAGAIAFYKQALGAVEVMRMAAPDGKRILHATIKIGDSTIMLADEFLEYCQPHSPRSPRTLGGTTVTIHVNSPDVDKTLAAAAAAGGRIVMPAANMFWGDRYGQFLDPYGHLWSVATPKQKLTLEEAIAAGKVAFARADEKMQQNQQQQ